jgi:hypothetical protein
VSNSSGRGYGDRERDALLRRCDELLDLLHTHPDHVKLQRLVVDIQSLRDRLLAEKSGGSGGPS